MSTPYQQPPQHGPDGPRPQRPWYKKKRWVIPLGFVALSIIVAPFSGGSDGPGNASNVTITDQPLSDSLADTPTEPVETTTTKQAVKPATKPKKTKTVSAGERQAVSKAEDYLDYQAFSRQGLIKQLKYEKFTTSEATYAVDHVTVNWRDEAAKKAEEYLEAQSFSRSGLVQQLKYEGFTASQAKHGVAVAYK